MLTKQFHENKALKDGWLKIEKEIKKVELGLKNSSSTFYPNPSSTKSAPPPRNLREKGISQRGSEKW